MASVDALVTEFVQARGLEAGAVRRLENGGLQLEPLVAHAVCGAVRLLDPERREALVLAARGFDKSVTESVLQGLHADALWSPGMLEHVAAEAALTLVIAAKLGVIEG